MFDSAEWKWITPAQNIVVPPILMPIWTESTEVSCEHNLISWWSHGKLSYFIVAQNKMTINWLFFFLLCFKYKPLRKNVWWITLNQTGGKNIHLMFQWLVFCHGHGGVSVWVSFQSVNASGRSQETCGDGWKGSPRKRKGWGCPRIERIGGGREERWGKKGYWFPP